MNPKARRNPAAAAVRAVFILLGVMAPALTNCRRPSSAASPAPVQPAAPLELRLMSFNVRYENNEDVASRSWRQRLHPIVCAIHDESPDVIGVQELLHGQAADLRASLPQFAFAGVGRNDGHRSGEYAAIFYQHERFTADPHDQGTFWLSDTPDVPGSKTWGNEIPRIASWLRLTEKTTGRGFYVFNTHWDHRHQGSRERAAVLLATRIDQRRHPQLPVVLLGDFNAEPHNPGVAYLTGRNASVPGSNSKWAGALVDPFELLHGNDDQMTTLHFWRGNRKGNLKVDHILVSRSAKPLAAAIRDHDEPMISDHFPVTARVVFP